MGRKFCFPNRKSGYKTQLKEDYVTFHKFRVEWKHKIDRGNWDVTNQSFICSKHFQDSDLSRLRHMLDTNNRRKMKTTKREPYE